MGSEDMPPAAPPRLVANAANVSNNFILYFVNEKKQYSDLWYDGDAFPLSLQTYVIEAILVFSSRRVIGSITIGEAGEVQITESDDTCATSSRYLLPLPINACIRTSLIATRANSPYHGCFLVCKYLAT